MRGCEGGCGCGWVYLAHAEWVWVHRADDPLTLLCAPPATPSPPPLPPPTHTHPQARRAGSTRCGTDKSSRDRTTRPPTSGWRSRERGLRGRRVCVCVCVEGTEVAILPHFQPNFPTSLFGLRCSNYMCMWVLQWVYLTPWLPEAMRLPAPTSSTHPVFVCACAPPQCGVHA